MECTIFTEPQQGATYATLLRIARASEDLGYDAFFRSDHYLAMGVDGLPGPTDAWLTLAGLARGVTVEGVQYGPIEAGLDARGSLVEVESTVWGALVAAADALKVDLLVTGTRGSTGLKALLRSSVAERVLKHCQRPVFIVPSRCEQQQPVTL